MRLTLRLLGLFMLMTFAACGGGGEDQTCPTTEPGGGAGPSAPCPPLILPTTGHESWP